MNLREMIGDVFNKLGDPAENQEAIYGEVNRALSHGEMRVMHMLPNVEREKMATTSSQSTAIGTAEYLTPTDTLDLIRVEYDGIPVRKLPLRNLSALINNPSFRASRQRQLFYAEIGSTAGRTKIILYPTPPKVATLKIWYFRRPFEYHDMGTYLGAVTRANLKTGAGQPTMASSVSTTVFHDANATFAANLGATPTDTTPDTSTTPAKFGFSGFWNDCEIRFTSGNNEGQRRRITTFKDYVAANAGVVDGLDPVTGGATHVASYGRFVFASTDAWLNTPGEGDTFEADQVSILQTQFHDLVTLWAAFVLAPKAGRDPAPFLAAFKEESATIGLKYVQNVEVPTPGEVPGGAR